MVASIFKDYISKWMSAIVGSLTAKINDKEEEIQYEHKKYLRPEFSPDMKYSSLSSNTTIVAADVVSLDSELPLKSRGSQGSAQGEIPKLGMIKQMNESQLQALKNMKARGTREEEIVRKLFSDIVDGVKGVYERLDIMFLQALSTGVTLITDAINVGTGVRVDFGVLDSHRFAVQTEWLDPDATPVDDIDNVKSNARTDGFIPNYLWMDKVTFNAFKLNDQVRKGFAGTQRVDPSHLFRLSEEDVRAYVREEFSMEIIVVDKVVRIEKAGKITSYEPWERGSVAFTTGTQLGTVTWSELAELDSPVAGVEYGTVDNFILTSIFRTNNPLKENSSVQALALPVLDNTEGIFLLDTTAAQSDDDAQTEGDANYTHNGTLYTKQSVVDGINEARIVDDGVAEAKITHADSTLAGKIKKLSDEGIEIFEAELITV